MLYKQPTSVATLRKYMSCSYPRNLTDPIYYFLSGEIGETMLGLFHLTAVAHHVP